MSKILLIILFIMCPASLVLGTLIELPSLQTASFTFHAPIRISRDSDFENIAVSGSGNKTDPFILEGWQIITEGDINGINIRNTTKYFVIRNCWIEASSSAVAIGILIQDVSPGTVTIANNTIQQCWMGIVVRDINSTKILNNRVKFNGAYGIAFYGIHAYNIIIANNTCSQNFHIGIYIARTMNSSIDRNLITDNAEWGLYLDECYEPQIKYNSFIKNEQQVEIYDAKDIFYRMKEDFIDFSTKSFRENYWSDYLGTGNYTVCRYKDEQIEFRIIDQFPLIKSPHNYVPPKNYLFKFFIIFLLILFVGVLCGTIIFITLNQVVVNHKTLQNIYILLIKTGSLILLIQNTLILGFVFLFQGMQTFKEMEIISFFIFHLDLLGFLLLAIGFLYYSSQSPDVISSYLYGGLALMGWIICRVLTQYVIPFGLSLHEYQEPLDYQTFAFYLVYRGIYIRWWPINYPGKSNIDLPPLILIITFILAGILLFLGSHFIQQTREDKSVSIFKWYGILNLITIISLLFVYYQEFDLIGIFINNYVTAYSFFIIKIILIPILGIITFFLMFHDSSNLIEK